MDFEAALALVKSKRPIVYPNSGFREQLNLYYQLKFTVNTEGEEYKEFCAKLTLKRGKKAKYSVYLWITFLFLDLLVTLTPH